MRCTRFAILLLIGTSCSAPIGTDKASRFFVGKAKWEWLRRRKCAVVMKVEVLKREGYHGHAIQRCDLRHFSNTKVTSG